MSLKRLTVVSKSNDTSFAGTVLFNSKFIQNAQNYNTTQTSFFYRRTDEDRTPELYIVSDALGTVVEAFDPASQGKINTYEQTYAIVTFRDDINDSTSDTTNKVIDFEDIVKGIALPSDTTQSILWLAKGSRKTVKVLVDKFLKALEDQSSTGTTTTYE